MQADHDQVMRLLRTARGQIEGIMRMVEEDRYCIDVSNQLMATEKLLAKTNALVLNAHVEHCVRSAATAGTDGDRDAKITEIAQIIEKLASK